MGIFRRVSGPFMNVDGAGAGAGAADLGGGAGAGEPGAGSGGNDNGGQGGTGTGDQGGAGGAGAPDFDPDLDTPTLTKRQVAQMMSGRVNEVKKQYEQFGTYQETAKAIGDIIGTDDPKIIHERIMQLRNNHLAQRAGMTPQGFQTIQQQTQQTTQTIEQFRREQAAREFDTLVANKDFADAALFKDEIVEMVANGMPIQRAYWAVAGELKASKRAQQASFEAEQLALNNIQNNNGKSVQPGAAGKPGGQQAQIPADVVAAAQKIGMDPAEYAQWMGVGNIEQARALRRK